VTTAYEAYKDYLALRNHFNTPGYDYFKYRGKATGSVASFEKRKDRFFFEKLAKHRDPHGLMVANFVCNPKTWIKDIAYSEDASKTYEAWVKRLQSLTYLITEDAKKLDPDFNSNFLVQDGEHPNILRLYLGGQISLETLIVFCDMLECLGYWEKKMVDDPVWEDISLKIKKYKPFIKYDSTKIKQRLVDIFREE
jgi:hypothetical protein